MKRLIVFCLFYAFCCTLWANPAIHTENPYLRWKERVILEGKKELTRLKKVNARNDARGRSEENRYVVLIAPENIYPDAEFLKQRKGKNRGGDESVSYLLDQQTLTSIDNTLRLMNGKSLIKTYVLLVHFMPLEFVNEIPDNQSIADFFNNEKVEMVSRVAQPISNEARDIVNGITANALSKVTDPTLYCGFVHFKVFKNDKEGMSQWVYYPKNSQIKFDDNYKRMLGSMVSTEKWPLGDVSKVNKLIEVIRKNNEEYAKIEPSLASIMSINDPDQMHERIKPMSMDAITSFSTEQRLHVLKVLASATIFGDREALILKLLLTVQNPQEATQVITAMGVVNDKLPEKIKMQNAKTGTYEIDNPKKGWCLLKCLTHEMDDASLGVWGRDNYQHLIKAFIRLCKLSPAFLAKVDALGNTENTTDITGRTIFYNYNSMWSKLASTISTFPNPKIDRNTGYSGYCGLTTNTELFFSYLWPDDELSSLDIDPFEPIVFVNQSDLGLLSNVDDSGNTFVSPGIILKYADDKAWNQTTTDVTMAAIDAASMATGYGELKAGVTGIRKAWTIIDMVNSGINLTLNITLATENPQVKKILDAYNLVTGGVALTQSAKSLKAVFTFNKGKKLFDRADIVALMKALEDGSDDVLKNFPEEDLVSITRLVEKVKQEASVRSLTALETQANTILAKLARITEANGKLAILLKNTDFKKIYDDFASGITKRKFADVFSLREEAAIKFYTNETYFKFNEALIAGSKADDILEIEKLLNNTLDKLSSTSGTFFRGIGKTEIDKIKQLGVGGEIPYDNFVSSSADELFAWRFLRNNKVKTGEGAFVEVISKNGKDINTFSDASELEILHKSKSKFEIKSIEYVDKEILNLDDVALSGATPDVLENFYRIVLVEK